MWDSSFVRKQAWLSACLPRDTMDLLLLMRLSWYQLSSTEAHQWGCPITEAHQWGWPITETHQWGWPITEAYQWGCPITEVHQWGCPILDVQPPKHFFSTSYASLGNSLQSWNSDKTNLDQSCPVTPLRSHSYEEVELRSITSSMDQSPTPFPNYRTSPNSEDAWRTEQAKANVESWPLTLPCCS